MEPPAGRGPAQAQLLAELIGGDGAHRIARQLLDGFGSLGRIVAAPAEALARQSGEVSVAARISAARDLVLAGQVENLERRRFDLNDERVQRYIIGLFAGHATERVHAIYLDRSHRYLASERLAVGSAERVSGSKRELVSRAFDIGAVGVVLAHNHPSANPEPSETDIHESRLMARLLAELELTLSDHLIVAGTTIFSMRGAGLL